jgi:N-acetylmuramoyl-L-alanine amidase
MKKNAKVIVLACMAFFTLLFTFFHYSAADVVPDIDRVKTLEDILQKRKKYSDPISFFESDRVVNILIVPGHDNESPGAVFGGHSEVDFNRMVAQKLQEYLSLEPGINVINAHSQNEYSSFLKNTFDLYKDDIKNFMTESINNFSKQQTNELEDPGFHNTASPDVRFRLYGINWWANKNDIDLVIHIHFNDYRRSKREKNLKYDGFSIYVPGEKFNNHELSKKLGTAIFEELKKIRPISNLGFEKEGIIVGHELIALGSHNSLKAGSVLLEYGYIYEELFQDKNKRDIAFDYIAYSTYAGIKKLLNEEAFFKKLNPLLISENQTTQDNLKWQFEKALEGVYPPEGYDLRSCPIDGYFGECSLGVK